VAIRQSFVPEIIRLAQQSAKTGAPIVRNLEFEFPDQGFADCKDQFMLGEDILVAPMLESGSSRDVLFPKGTWKDKNGNIIKGPVKKQMNVPLDELLWFRKIEKKSAGK
jgi:alpha-glucosidase (family GH31 glycosyl hydrolase)